MQFQYVALFAIIYLGTVQGAGYEFVIEDDEIFSKCPEYPDALGFYEFFDLSQMEFVYKDGSIKVIGNSTGSWEGIQPTDRIAVRGDVYKLQRGAWQPTLISVYRNDYCKILFDTNSITYQFWSQYIFEEDRKCFNHYGHTYHHNPFYVNAVLEFAGKMEGRHKIVVRLFAYDVNDVKREKTVCFQILGEYVKVKGNTTFSPLDGTRE